MNNDLFHEGYFDSYQIWYKTKDNPHALWYHYMQCGFDTIEKAEREVNLLKRKSAFSDREIQIRHKKVRRLKNPIYPFES